MEHYQNNDDYSEAVRQALAEYYGREISIYEYRIDEQPEELKVKIGEIHKQHFPYLYQETLT